MAADKRGRQPLQTTDLLRLNSGLQQFVNLEQFSLSLDLDRFERTKTKCACRQAIGALANEYLTAGGGPFQTRRDIHRVPHHGVTHAQITSDISGYDCSGIDADMKGKRLL